MDQIILQRLDILQKELAEIRASLFTKSDAKSFLTKEDAKNFATKNDLEKMKSELIEQIKESEMFAVANTHNTMADKKKVEALQRQVDKLEQKLTA